MSARVHRNKAGQGDRACSFSNNNMRLNNGPTLGANHCKPEAQGRLKITYAKSPDDDVAARMANA